MPYPYEVKQGDCISSIAYAYGFFPDTIWNDPVNAELKNKRKDPNVLLPGDVVLIPEKQAKEVAKPTDARHLFKRKGVPKIFRIQFKTGDEPIANTEYLLLIKGNATRGKTDGEGWIKCPIQPDARLATVQIEGEEFQLQLGHLDPLDTLAGIQGRLQQLGFYDGEINGVMDDETEASVKIFQRSNNLESTGRVDQALKDLLKKLVGE